VAEARPYACCHINTEAASPVELEDEANVGVTVA
jgi:hypothetical protein